MPLENPQGGHRHLRLVQPKEHAAAGQQESSAYTRGLAADSANVPTFGAGVLNAGSAIAMQDARVVRSLAAGNKPQRGLMASFSNTCHRWQLSEEAHLILLGFAEDRYLGEQILYGRLNPPRDTRARASCVVSISVGLGALFNENAAAELHWLQTPISRLNEKTPLSLMLEGDYQNLFAVRREVERARGLG